MMTKKPNIIYILADDMGYGDISALNERCAWKTPNIDAICENGMVFTDAHSSSAVCTPSRYSILTGRYNWRSACKKHIIFGYSMPLIEKGRKTVADMLQDNGYTTCAIGKWHLGMNLAKKEGFQYAESPSDQWGDKIDYAGLISDSPIHHGFDYFYGISASLNLPPYLYIENDHFTEMPQGYSSRVGGKDKWFEGPIGPGFRHETVLPNLTNKVLEKINAYRDRPFFIYFPLTAPHTPILPVPEFQGKSRTNAYGDFILMCDDVIKQITDKLRELDLYDNTMVIFASDNGCSPQADFEELEKFGHNPSYIFRGAKADIYEGGHRIPLAISYPPMIQPGTVCNQTVCLADFTATVADMLGIGLPDDMAEDSFSILPLLKGQDEPIHTSLVHHSVNGSLALRKGRYKLEMCPGSGGWSYPTMRDKLPDNAPEFQLYDLDTDIKESNNIIRENEKIFHEMKKELVSIVKNGRSTPGKPQANTGGDIWEAVQWIEKE